MTDVTQTAREMGWRPREEFRGDPEKWVDAETFVSRGEHYIPIINADRRKLREKAEELEAGLRETRDLLRASQEAIEELKKYHADDTRRQVEAARKQLIEQLKEARDSGDVDAELKLQRQLNKAEAALEAEPPAPSPAPAAAPAPVKDPDFEAWLAENQWFTTSPRKRGLAMGVADEIKSDPATKHLTGKAFYQKLSEELEKEPGFGGDRPDKVSGGRPNGGSAPSSGGSRTRTYADLPSDAKAACDQQERRLVGPGRAFKDQAAWRAYYTQTYFAGEQE